MAEYRLEFTDKNIPTISVSEKEEIYDLVDITLFGFTRLQYGRDLNENFVHLLENFAAPESSESPGTPDFSQIITIDDDEENGLPLLWHGRPLEGQVWYNKSDTDTGKRPYVFYDDEWHPIEVLGREVAANWGQIADGEQIPRPQSESGYLFPYSECSWIVAPFNQLNILEDMVCYTDDVANVTMKYTYSGDSSQTSGVANYMIVGLKDNNNLGTTQTPEPPPSQTPTPTPTTSAGASPTPTPTNTPTPTPTPSNSQGDALTVSTRDTYNASCSTTSLSCTASIQLQQGGFLNGYSISGGTPPYTLFWEYTGTGQSFNIVGTSSTTPILERGRTVEQLNVSGEGRLTVTDNVGATAFDEFLFITDHEETAVTPTPSASEAAPTPTPSASEPEPLTVTTTSPGACNQNSAPVYNDTFCNSSPDGYSSWGDTISFSPSSNISVSGGVAPYSYFIVPGTEQFNQITANGVANINVDSNVPGDGVISLSYIGAAGSPTTIELDGSVSATLRITDSNGDFVDEPVSCEVYVFRTCDEIE